MVELSRPLSCMRSAGPSRKNNFKMEVTVIDGQSGESKVVGPGSTERPERICLTLDEFPMALVESRGLTLSERQWG